MNARRRTHTPRWTFWIALPLILAVAAWVRTYHLNWDEGTHLHPDERYLTMVTAAIHFPDSLAAYWDTAHSPLNPANQNQPAYVYGTLPLFVTRAVGAWVDRACGDAPAPLPSLVRRLLFDTAGPCYPGTYVGYGSVHLVGRYLSTLADLCTLLALVLTARLLYDEGIALLAGGLYAFAVLPIQHAHFFVVDSFATVFVMWTLYLVARAVVRQRPLWLIVAGLTTGFAAASKITTWPLAGMVGLGGILIRREDGKLDLGLTQGRMLVLMASGMLAALAFRVTQPYAFSGPGFFDVRPDPHWVETMRGAKELASGLRDVPFGHQWTDRTPIIFPWVNMVFWGMGLPLGLTAWLGWAAAGLLLFGRGRWRHLIPWLWGTIFFLYQGTQWVKSMRYLLPTYPVFTLMAAWLLMRLVVRARGRRRLYPAAVALAALTLAGTAGWAAAFLEIYRRPVTRIEASRWMYHHIPTAVTLTTASGEPIQVPVRSGTALVVQTTAPATPFTPDTTAVVTAARVNKIAAFEEMAGRRTLRVRLARDAAGRETLAEGRASVEVPAAGTVAVEVPLPPTPVNAGETLYLLLNLEAGEVVTLDTSVLANEHWDDPLPLRIDGKDAFGNWYRGLRSSPSTLMNLYDNDTPAKREQLLNWLDEADYVVMTSNRLYASIPRLPMRYPLTVAYYRAMFDGSLGFELLARFVSFPALGPCQFPDQEVPFPLPEPRYTNSRPCSVPFPPAEEAFSVYDHPQVLIFAKTPSYSRARAEALLPLSLTEHVQWMTPLQATRRRRSPGGGEAPMVLMMTPERRAEQEAGGTWSRLFHRTAPQNRSQLLAVFLWWLMIAALGWIAFPWVYHAFPLLHDRGYALARIAGLLFWTYPVWLLASLHWVSYSRTSLWAAFLLLGIGSALTVHRYRAELEAFVRTRWRTLLRIEAIYLALYLAWVYVRYLNPDLWHPVVGGEKPMDFAYLNAVIKSTWFPPYDPWFAGGLMNYYYYGFVLIGSLIKALGIIPSVAYNLAVPSVFAMTGVGAYTLAATLSGGEAARQRRAGLLGVLLVLLVGNLGEVRLLFKGFEQMGGVTFESLIPGYPALVSALVGMWKVLVQGAQLNFRPEWWYWDATRVIPFAPGEPGAINEFPLFTFLYADLHAHMLAFPLTQLALGVALQWSLHAGRPSAYPAQTLSAWLRVWMPYPLMSFIIAALVGGALRATNTWDYPTYVALMAFGVVLNLLQPRPADEGRLSTLAWGRLLIPVLTVALAELLFRPYTQHNITVYHAFGLWQGTRTPLGIYLIMHGHFLFPIALLALWHGGQTLRRLWKAQEHHVLMAILAAGGGLTLLLLALVTFGVPVAWAVIPLGGLAALLVLDADHTLRTRTLWFWVGTALTLSLAVEIIVLKGDIGRMNTVFKFYLQVWMLLALAAAVAVERILSTLWSIPPAETWIDYLRGTWGDVVFTVLMFLLFGVILYPTLAIPARIRDRWAREAPHTLDGMAYMPYATQYEHGGTIPLVADYRVIHWLQDNVQGSPTIIEGQGEREYLWGNRISIYTGLPSVAAWRWHQVQQRMAMPPGTVEQRQSDIRAFYLTPDPDHAMRILERYHVRYVILGPYERAYMIPQGEPKFDTLVARGALRVVYEDEYTRVFEVARP